jgi:uncharacterized protein (TIGR02145 family)
MYDLEGETKYYVRAFAINDAGTGYGNEISFTTLPLITFNPNLTYGSISDIDGNSYKTIQIGTQVWMAENLKTTKYNDGIGIPTSGNVSSSSTPRYCWYNDDISNKKTYGALYNWTAVNTGKLCPTGWHVPSEEEWYELALYIDPNVVNNYPGGEGHTSFIVGGKLKETGTDHWNSPNLGATNDYGFTALPGGQCVCNNEEPIFGFTGIRGTGYWWTSASGPSPDPPDPLGRLSSTAWRHILDCHWSYDYKSTISIRFGISVRCIKD